MKFELNRRVPEVYKNMRLESLLVKAFGNRPVKTEAELAHELSKFPACKNKSEAKRFLKVSADLNLITPFTKNRSRFYEF